MELDVLVKRVKRALRAHDTTDLRYRVGKMREYLITHPDAVLRPIYQGKHQQAS